MQITPLGAALSCDTVSSSIQTQDQAEGQAGMQLGLHYAAHQPMPHTAVTANSGRE